MADKESYLNMLPTGIREPLRKLLDSGASITNAVVGNVTGNVTGNIVATTLSGALTGNVTGDIVGKHNLTLQSSEHAAGAVGTGIAPKTYRGFLTNGDILTSIQIDMTGLKNKGDAAIDVIALTGAGYIGRYVTSTCGICYKMEQIWLETPAGSATITADIDIAMDDEDDIAYDGAVDGGVILNTGGSITAGMTFESLVPALTANDYIYIVEAGAGDGDTGTYTAGQFILNLYGHPVLS
jgi:hypothetical protein